MSADEAALHNLLGIDRGNTAWMDAALCAQEDPDIWFPERGESRDPVKAHLTYKKQVAMAARICKECPVETQCLADARERGETDGVWGGVDFHVPKGKSRAA